MDGEKECKLKIRERLVFKAEICGVTWMVGRKN